MAGENFVYFFTVQGFFLGLILGVLKSFDAESLLLYTFLISGFFYLFSHFIIALYYNTSIGKLYFFPKEAHEKRLDFYVNEINKREKSIDSVLAASDTDFKEDTQESER